MRCGGNAEGIWRRCDGGTEGMRRMWRRRERDAGELGKYRRVFEKSCVQMRVMLGKRI